MMQRTLFRFGITCLLAVPLAAAIAVAGANAQSAEQQVALVSPPDPTDPTPESAYGAYEQGLYLSAYRQSHHLARQNIPTSQTLLGYLYQLGLGIPRDPAKAVRWYSQAAVAGNREAQFELALMLARGEGTPVDRLKAKGWFEEAIKQGHVAAH